MRLLGGYPLGAGVAYNKDTLSIILVQYQREVQ